MGRRADPKAAAVWGERVRRQRRSGLSIAAFCAEEDICQTSFFRWRKRLAEKGSAKSNGGERRQRGPAPGARFVPVEISDPPSSGGIEIELPGGAVVRLPAEASDRLIRTSILAAAAASTARASGHQEEDA